MTFGFAIAQRIDEFLVERNISLYKLAKDACLPISTLQNLYRGHTKSPSITLVYKIAAALKITVAEFLDTPLFSLDNIELD